MKILLIAGGWSTERDISIAGAKNIEKALKSNGHDVTFFDLLLDFDNLLNQAKQHDFAFINLHGAPGEDGLVQAILERVGCPYQGSSPAGSFLALNKVCAKQIFKYMDLPTAEWEFLPQRPNKSWSPKLEYPIFVKSNTGGSSLHLGRATDRKSLDYILDEIFSAGDSALLEKELVGQEITCGILGDVALPPVLIKPVSGLYFDFNSKYANGGAQEICPAPISDKLTKEIQNLALQAHNALGLRCYSRTDFILGNDDSINILEVNTLPGMTSTSLVPQEAKAIGLSFSDLLEKLIELGIKNFKK